MRRTDVQAVVRIRGESKRLRRRGRIGGIEDDLGREKRREAAIFID